MSLAAAANPPCHVARQAIYKWYQTFVISNDIIVDLVLALVVHTTWVFSVWNGTYDMALSTGAIYCLATYPNPNPNPKPNGKVRSTASRRTWRTW